MTTLSAISISIALLAGFSSSSATQSATTDSKSNQAHGSSRAPSSGRSMVDDHVKWLTQQLSLTADQQRKVREILEAQREDTQKVIQDQSLSREQRMEKARSARDTAHSRIREVLNADQKKKLDATDQQERERMRQGHGSLPPGHPPL